MYIRIVRPQFKPGTAEAAAKHWEQIMRPRVEKNPDVQRGFMAATADRSSVVAITIWSNLPDEAATKQMMDQIAQEMQEFTAGPPSAETYEVIGQI
jgi:hypothetical protein